MKTLNGLNHPVAGRVSNHEAAGTTQQRANNPFLHPVLIALVVLISFARSTLAVNIFIPDANLNAAICEALQIPIGPVTQQDMLNLKFLTAESRNIRNLQGLEAAHNLS